MSRKEINEQLILKDLQFFSFEHLLWHINKAKLNITQLMEESIELK